MTTKRTWKDDGPRGAAGARPLRAGSRARRFLATVAPVALLLCSIGRALPAGGFPIHDLGTFGGTSAQAMDVNERGDVVGGAADADGNYHPFVVRREGFTWFRDQDSDGRNDLMLDMGSLGGTSGVAYALNEEGDIVGQSSDAGDFARAFISDGVQMTDIGGPAGQHSRAYSVNEDGVVVGEADIHFGSSSGHPFLWKAGATTHLGDSHGVAFAIDSAGRVAGVRNDFAYHGFVIHPSGGSWFQDTTPADGVNDLLTDIGPGEVRGMNDAGLLVGAVNTKPAIWKGVWLELATLPGLGNGYATAANNWGEVVGHDFSGQNRAVFVYLPQPAYGLDAGIYNLKTLVPGSAWTSFEGATGINDEGVVVGWGTHLGKTAAFVVELGGSVLVDPPAPDVAANFAFAGEGGDPVNTFTGEHVVRGRPDIDLGGPGQVAFARTYCSGLAKAEIRSTLGDGWLHNWDATLTVDATSARAVLPQGRRAVFDRTGATWTLTGTVDIPYQLVTSGSFHVLYDPDRDRIWSFDLAGRPALIENSTRGGVVLAYTAGLLTTVSDGLGRVLTFGYDGEDRLTSVTDGTRTTVFEHDGNLLTSVTDAAGKKTTYTYDPRGRLTGETRPEGNTPFTRSYSTHGRVVSETDAYGNATLFSYDALAGSTRISDPSGHAMVHVHTAAGTLASSTDAAGAGTSITSDAAGRRSGVQDPVANVETTTYHAASGRVATLVSGGGATTSFTWTARNHPSGIVLYDLTRVGFPDGRHEAFEYDESGLMTQRTDRAGEVWTWSHARSAVSPNPVVSTVETNPLGGVTTWEYDTDGTLKSVTDPDSQVTGFGYDPLRRRTAVVLPGGSKRSTEYDAMDRVTSVTLEDGAAFSRKHDSNGNLLRATSADRGITLQYDLMDRITGARFVDGGASVGGAAAATWDAAGRMVTMAGRAGAATTYGFDVAGNEVSSADPLGTFSATRYDAAGRVLGRSNGLGAEIGYVWDADGRAASVTSPAGRVSTYQYDLMDRAIRRTLDDRLTRIAYDARGLATLIDVEGIGVACLRDGLGNVVDVTDPASNHWLIGRDTQGRITKLTDPLARETTFTHDARGRPVVMTAPGGATTTWTYDEVGNVTQVDHSSGLSAAYTYDGRGRMTSGPHLALTYDARGRISDSNGIALTRDDAGRIATVTYAPGKTVTYAYDVRGRVTRVTDWTPGFTDLVYDAAGQLTAIVRPNGVTTARTYDADGFLVRIDETKDAAPLATTVLARDGRGLIRSAVRTPPVALPVTLVPAAVESTFDAASQDTSFTYDQLGRVVADGRRTYTWDGLDRLVGYGEGADSVALTYDGNGLLVARDDGRTTTNRVWNYATGLPTVAKDRLGAADERYYVCLPTGELLHSVAASDGAHRFHHFDEMGNTAFTTDDTGLVEAAFAYSPYGDVVASSGTSGGDRRLWQGRAGVLREGETGLHYVRNRWYDAATGRFLTRDPLRRIGPLTFNPYAYAAGNPMLFVDPTGLGDEPPEITTTDLATTAANTYASVVSDLGGAADRKLTNIATAAGDGPGGRALKDQAARFTKLNNAFQHVGEAGFAVSGGIEVINTRNAARDVRDRRDAVLAATMDNFDVRFREARRLKRAKRITPEQYEKMVLDMNRALLEEIQGISEGAYWEESLAYTEGGLKAVGTAAPLPSSAWDRYFDWLK